MTQHPSSARFSPANGAAAAAPRVGVVEGALGTEQQLASIAALFPHVRFEAIGPTWPEHPPAGYLIVAADAALAADIDAAVRRLRAAASAARIVVMLRNADVSTTRLLMREGAADVEAFSRRGSCSGRLSWRPGRSDAPGDMPLSSARRAAVSP